MKREYSLATEKLIDRMCLQIEREDVILDKKKAEEALLKTYDLFNISRPKEIIWCKDIFDEKFARNASNASNARNARNAWNARNASNASNARNARNAWNAWNARNASNASNASNARNARNASNASNAWNAWNAWNASNAWNAYWCALDYDFNWYVFEYEYCKNPDKGYEPNDNDHKYIKYSELLMEAIEAGVGYMAEWENILYVASVSLSKLDEQNRLHSLEKSAVRWIGGKELYFVHGIEVPEKWIKTPSKLTKKDWLEESNLEKRRIIQELMGAKFPKKIGCKLVSKASKEYKEVHNLLGLYEVELPNDPDKIARYVRVKDHSSKREYYIRVDPKISDADSALAWTFGFTKKTYKPQEET